MTEYLFTYEQFVAALEKRPESQSPLMWLVELHPRPPQASEWMMRWLRSTDPFTNIVIDIEKEETK